MVLTPEESVRQTCLLHLMDLGYAHKQIAVEKSIKVNTLIRRFDILVYDRQGRPYLLVECKAPAVRLSQTDLDQMSAYQYN
ncbi:MAG: type I restriction enzyme HsdR N-terminal domain-containing protein, partial [Bacteroidota bacterium]